MTEKKDKSEDKKGDETDQDLSEALVDTLRDLTRILVWFSIIRRSYPGDTPEEIGGTTAENISNHLGLKKPTVYHHLNKLMEKGLIEKIEGAEEKIRGSTRYYYKAVNSSFLEQESPSKEKLMFNLQRVTGAIQEALNALDGMDREAIREAIGERDLVVRISFCTKEELETFSQIINNEIEKNAKIHPGMPRKGENYFVAFLGLAAPERLKGYNDREEADDIGSITCEKCKKGFQADFKFCPYCATPVPIINEDELRK